MASANVSEYFEETRDVIADSQIVSPTEQPLVFSGDGCADFHSLIVKKRAEQKPRKMWVEKAVVICTSCNVTSRNRPQLGDKKQKQTKSKEEQSFDRVFEKLKKRRIETTSLFSYLTFLVPKKDQTNETYAFSEHFLDVYDNTYPQHEGFTGFQSLDWSKTVLFSIPI